MKEKIERNSAIYTDRIVGKMTYKAIAQKYGISAARVGYIIERMKNKNNDSNSCDPGRPLTIDEAYLFYK